jgi:hypothetical protein
MKPDRNNPVKVAEKIKEVYKKIAIKLNTYRPETEEEKKDLKDLISLIYEYYDALTNEEFKEGFAIQIASRRMFSITDTKLCKNKFKYVNLIQEELEETRNMAYNLYKPRYTQEEFEKL